MGHDKKAQASLTRMARSEARDQDDDQDNTLDEGFDFDLDVEDQNSARRELTVIDRVDERIDHSDNVNQVMSTGVTLPQRGVFERLSPQVQRRLLLVGRRIQFTAGTAINSVGDPCHGLSFIISGRVQVEWMDALGWVPIAQLAPGDVVGAMEWADGKCWEERLHAEEDTLILFLPTSVLNPLTATYPDLQRQVERYTERHSLHALLGSHPAFRSLEDEEMLHLIDVAQLRYFTPGTVLYSPQMILALLFVIGRGEVELRSEERVIQTLGRGEVLNLELCLGERPHLLTGVVITDVTLYVLPFDEVEIMLSRSGGLQQLQREAHLLRARALNE